MVVVRFFLFVFVVFVDYGVYCLVVRCDGEESFGVDFFKIVLYYFEFVMFGELWLCDVFDDDICF